jgi:hypothetical protein
MVLYVILLIIIQVIYNIPAERRGSPVPKASTKLVTCEIVS